MAKEENNEDTGADVTKQKDEKPAEPKVYKGGLPKRDYLAFERELRRYVRRDGGFRKDLPKEDRKRAEELMKKLGRKKPEWDLDCLIAGIDKPTVKQMDFTKKNKQEEEDDED